MAVCQPHWILMRTQRAKYIYFLTIGRMFLIFLASDSCINIYLSSKLPLHSNWWLKNNNNNKRKAYCIVARISSTFQSFLKAVGAKGKTVIADKYVRLCQSWQWLHMRYSIGFKKYLSFAVLNIWNVSFWVDQTEKNKYLKSSRWLMSCPSLRPCSLRLNWRTVCRLQLVRQAHTPRSFSTTEVFKVRIKAKTTHADTHSVCWWALGYIPKSGQHRTVSERR